MALQLRLKTDASQLTLTPTTGTIPTPPRAKLVSNHPGPQLAYLRRGQSQSHQRGSKQARQQKINRWFSYIQRPASEKSRQAKLRVLVTHGPSIAVPVIQKLFQAKGPHKVRQKYLRAALAKLGSKAVPFLLHELKRKGISPSACAFITNVLSTVSAKQQAKTVVTALETLLTHKNWAVRLYAVRTLGIIGKKYPQPNLRVRTILEQVRDNPSQNQQVKMEAIKALQNL